ncbi:hypothetical protein [Vibrio navarrensis]|uniref:hypothetical protein n=1 Tax=Vibrio navarrensis TaxID=29495 RepID=UPI00186A30C1|nr:hypothetical protein [Vibrio navarrensis]
MSSRYRTNRFKRRDHCPQCGDIDFLCTEYIMDNQVYLYEEQCPKCYDFWQIGLDDVHPNRQNKGVSNESLL